MAEKKSASHNLLNGFIRISQYLIGLPDAADIWQETPRALIKFFKDDVSFVAGVPNPKKSIKPFCLCRDEDECQQVLQSCSHIAEEVMRDGFLASELIDLPKPHAMAFLPVNINHQVVAVLVVGHCQEEQFGREELNIYLGVTSLLETILAKKVSEQRFQLMADNVPEMLFRIVTHPDQAGNKRFDYVSKGSLHVLGCTPEELKSTPSFFFDNLVAEDYLSLDRQMMEAAAGGERFIHTVRWQAEGKQKFIELHAQALQEGNGVTYLDGAARDITDSKKAVEQIRKAKEDWERTFDAIGDIVTLLDSEMRILQVNTATCKVLNAAPDELIGRFCYEVFEGRTDLCPDCPAVTTIRECTTHVGEITHESLDSTFQVSTSPLTDEAGKLISIVHFAKDISEQKNLEQQLRQTQKMSAIGNLAGGIAHDFNNLLVPIIGYGDMLLFDLPEDSSYVTSVKEIVQAGHRARDLVSQILTFSRKSEQEHVSLCVQAIAKEVVKLLRSSIPTTIEIKQSIDYACPAVMADPTQIHQIIMNLCTNAYHSMRKNGGILGIGLAKVDVQADDFYARLNLQPGVYVRLEVSDTGHGMTPETRERIFEPYFTTKEKGDGTGLGLAVAHGIVSSCQGTIVVYSEPGQGSSFHVYLPAIIGKEEEELEKAAEVLIRGDAHVLVVDDAQEIIDLEKSMLEVLGYSVTAFSNPEKALALFQAQPDDFDLLLTDMTMPGMTGVQLVEEVFAIRPKMPVILCTGFSELINEKQAEALGIRGYIMKPLLMKDFARAIHKVLGEESSG